MPVNPWQANDTHWDTEAGWNTIPAYDPTTAKHFWVVSVAFSWTPDTTLLDHENEVGVTEPLCIYCHATITTEIYNQPCPGPPT